MSRIRFMVGAIAVVGTLVGICSAQIQLPTSVYTNPGGSNPNLCLVGLAWAAGTYGPTWYVEDGGNDGETGTYSAYMPAYGHVTNSDGTATADVEASSFVSSGTSTFIETLVLAIASVQNYADAHSGVAYATWNANSVSAFGYHSVVANPNYPTAGSDEGSATLYATYFLQVNGAPENRDDFGWWVNLITHSKAGDLYADAIDVDGEYYHIYGTLSQTTSEDPTAEPLEVDDVVEPGAYFYYGTSPTQVSELLYSYAQFFIQSTVLGDGSESVLYNAEVIQEVYVP